MSGQVEVVKWYTRARRFPRLVGRTHTGGKIWGGPYTITQVVGAVVVVIVMLNTTSLWAKGSVFTNVAILAGITYAVVFALGKMPPDARNPLSVLAGAAGALVTPRQGRQGGRPLRAVPPQRLRARIDVQPTTDQRLSCAAPTARRVAAPVPAAASRPELLRRAPRPQQVAASRLVAEPAPEAAPALVGGPVPTGLQQALARAAAGRLR